MPETGTPTVVLVHGAFADASSWNGVIERLQARAVPVIAPANPLRGIATDSANLAGVLGEIDGPVIVVGHSYGGAVISNAAAQAKDLVALVFVAAFAPDEGETLGEASAASKDAVLATHSSPHTRDGSVELSIDPVKFHDAFAADLRDKQAAVMAATQRPIAQAGFTDANGPPAWKNTPSWAVVATGDKAAGSDVTRSMAKRANAKITELDGSHVIMVSQPQPVADVILEVVGAVASQADGQEMRVSS